MSGEAAYIPPTLESQYHTIHPGHLPSDRLAEVQGAIAEDGVYVGDALKSVFMKGAIEVIEPERPGGFLKVMPNIVELPSDHPVRKLYYEKLDRARQSRLAAAAIPSTSPKSEVMPRRDPSEFINNLAARSVEAMGTSHEALADFLQVFADVADSTHIGYGRSDDYVRVDYCESGFGMHARFIEDAGENGDTTYALLRGDMQVHRRPAATDEVYTVVNMETGDELRFMHSDISRIREGDYARTDRDGKPYAINPEKIAQLANIHEVYDADDPILILTRPQESRDGVILDTTLQNKEQVERYECLASLGSDALKNARITFAPETAEELLKVMAGYSSRWVAKHVARIVPPSSTARIVLDEEHRYALKNLLDGVSSMDDETQSAIFRCVESIDTRSEKDAWSRRNNIESLIRCSLTFSEDGSYSPNSLIELTKRLVYDREDFTEAVYKAAGGMYLESWTQKWGEPKATRNVSEKLNEQYARIYADVFESQLMDSVEAARAALHIPDDLPHSEQIVMLLQQHGHIEKGMRLINNQQVMRSRPDITTQQWAEICLVIDRCRDAVISEADRTTIAAYNLSPDAIAVRLKNGPGSTTEQIAVGLVSQWALY